MSDPRNDRFLEQIRHQLDASAEQLDEATLARLARIRLRAMNAESAARSPWRVPVLALASTAALAIISFSLVTTSPPTPSSSLEDLSLLSSNEPFELIDEIEFYQWLSDEASNG